MWGAHWTVCSRPTFLKKWKRRRSGECSPSECVLKLPESVRRLLRQTSLTERHARALLRLSDEETQLALTREAADRAMSVQQLEKLLGKETAARIVHNGDELFHDQELDAVTLHQPKKFLGRWV